MFSRNQISKFKKLSGNTPGARHIKLNDIRYFKNIFVSQSPYRLAGRNSKSICSRLEDKFKNFLNRKHFLLVSSGTAALHLAMEALNLKKNDEVLIPSYGWTSDILSIFNSKATPVLVPINRSLGIDPNYLSKAITKKTKAIIAIHMRGKVCEIDKIKKFARLNNLLLIEDCSQCFGGSLNSKKVGSFGDISTFSFQNNKLLTAGEGGAVATNYKKLFDQMNRFHDLGMGRSYGEKDPLKYLTRDLGLNYHFNELGAALLSSQFEKKNLILKNLKINYNKIKRLFYEIKENNPDFEFLIPNEVKKIKNNNAFFVVQDLKFKHINFISKTFEKNKIHFYPMKNQDGHNYLSWINFMKRNNIKFRVIEPNLTRDILEHSLFIEVNSKL